jgi:hypothetical protein
MGELKGMKELFGGRNFDREIIVLCVRWYLRYKLSLRDLVGNVPDRPVSPRTFGLLLLLHNPAKVPPNLPLHILRKLAPEPIEVT